MNDEEMPGLRRGPGEPHDAGIMESKSCMMKSWALTGSEMAECSPNEESWGKPTYAAIRTGGCMD